MPKMKTHRGTAKRIKATATGKFKRSKAFKRHILAKKAPGRKRDLRKATLVSESNEKQVRRLLPYA